MLAELLNQKSIGWMKALGAFVVWVSCTSWLLIFYGLQAQLAVFDAVIYSFLLIGGFILLENIFRYYLPTSSNLFLAFLFPVVLSVVVLFLGDYILMAIFKEQLNYGLFLEQVFPLRAFIILLIFIGYTFLLNYHGKLEEQAEAVERETQMQKMAKEAELYHLRQQLQPHFLFNSLNSISALVKSRPEKAREMVLQLSDFLRATIKTDGQQWISLSEEIAFLQLFLGIEKVRFGHRLQVSFDWSTTLKDFKMPQLLVQPLLENAVKHSVYGMTGQVHIYVEFSASEQGVLVRINNPYEAGSAQASGAGFGLEAVKRRLFLIFGRYDLLRIEKAEHVFSVQLLIPKTHDKDSNN